MILFDLEELLRAVDIQVSHTSTSRGLQVGAQLGGVPEDNPLRLLLVSLQLHQLLQLLLVGDVERNFLLSQTLKNLSRPVGPDIWRSESGK